MPLKKPITKAHIRNEMDQQIADFLGEGGEVAQIPQGISGRENVQGAIRAEQTAFQQPKAERTFLPEVVATLEARKQAQLAKNAPKPPKRRPRKKMIYDDFGEPLRWEWVE